MLFKLKDIEDRNKLQKPQVKAHKRILLAGGVVATLCECVV